MIRSVLLTDEIRTDINPSNIMFTIEDTTLLDDFEQAELASPSRAKIIDEKHTIFASRKLGLPKGDWGRPVLCDLGEARIGRWHQGLIQPELYRAPEVLFKMQWSFGVDIWSVATLVSPSDFFHISAQRANSATQVWTLFEDKHLFHGLDEKRKSSATHHVAEMVALMGNPPLEYIKRSPDTMNVFDEEGLLCNPQLYVSQANVAKDSGKVLAASRCRCKDWTNWKKYWMELKRRNSSISLDRCSSGFLKIENLRAAFFDIHGLQELNLKIVSQPRPNA